MEMILVRGKCEADKFSNLTQEQVMEMLKDIRKRYSERIKHYGTEIRMIQVQSWKQMIRNVEDLDLMITGYEK